MTLKKYLKQSNTTRADFAKRIGVSLSMLSCYTSGNRKPPIKRVLEIYLASEGFVGFDDFYGEDLRRLDREMWEPKTH